MSDLRLSVEHINRYLSLVERRLYIVMHSGVDWKPEYTQELQDIDNEISVLRQSIDAVHEERQVQEGSPAGSPSEEPQVQEDAPAVPREVSYQEYSDSRIAFFRLHGDGYRLLESELSSVGFCLKRYLFPDGASWFERMSLVTEGLSIRSHDIGIPLDVTFLKTEFWDTSCSVSRHCFENVQGVRCHVL